MKNYSMIPILMLIPTLLFSAGLLERIRCHAGRTDIRGALHTLRTQFLRQAFFELDLADGKRHLSPLSLLLAPGMTTNGAERYTLSPCLMYWLRSGANARTRSKQRQCSLPGQHQKPGYVELSTCPTASGQQSVPLTGNPLLGKKTPITLCRSFGFFQPEVPLL